MPAVIFSAGLNPNVHPLQNGYVLSNLKTLLSVADKGSFGVVACNIRSRFILNAVLEAAFQEKSPVILEVAESETKYCNMAPNRLSELAYAGISKMIDKYGYSVPVCLHHDHVQKDVDGCVSAAITYGFSSVEVDLSKLPLDQNIAKCKEVANKIQPLGISLEVEDGEIGTASALADPEVEKNIASYYSKPEDCARLVKESGADAIAFFVGNGHGQYLRKPIIGYARIKEICDAVRPLGVYGVMHGGSGLLPEDFNMCIDSGARKFNYATTLSDIWFKHFPKELVDRMNKTAEEQKQPVRKVLDQFEKEWDAMDFSVAEKEIKEHVAYMMKEAFKSSGKAEQYK